MIITLVKADFSANNIGTLDAWMINRSLGTGASYEGPNSIAKGEPLNTSVILEDGYEVASSGVVVTMGGNVVENAVTINESIITISIAHVTGNILIVVPTIGEALNLIAFTPDRYTTALRYSPGTSTIVGSSQTKYGLFYYKLEPNSTYNMIIGRASILTGNLFTEKPKTNLKTDFTTPFGYNSSAFTIVTDDTHLWLGLNVPTIETSDGTENQDIGVQEYFSVATLKLKQ